MTKNRGPADRETTAISLSMRRAVRAAFPGLHRNVRSIEIHDTGNAALFKYRGKVLFEIDWKALRQRLAREDYSLLRGLYALLWFEVVHGDAATTIADVELGTAKKRSAGGAKAAAVRQREANARDGALVGEAKKMRAANGRLSVAEIARRLAERRGGSVDVIYKKLLRLLRD
jgi:hypothetical protein